MREVIEVVSDSEEDRRGELVVRTQTVIEISSDDDDEQGGPARSKPPRRHATRKIIESNSESEDELSARKEPPVDPIDLTEYPTTPVKDRSTRVGTAPKYQSLYSGSEDSDDGGFEAALDDSILTYDPPKSSKKPIKIASPVKPPSREAVPKKRTTSLKRPTSPDVQPAGSSKPSTPRGPGRTSKRAQEAAERKELEEYAQRFFNKVNKTVFGNGLPPDTKLAWNARLLTTAGRARWHKHGEESSQIELATKILTSKERIENTLSHEMCHLASWVIDQRLNENHGQIFKKWAILVMEKYPDVVITTRHTYEISYKYTWECTNCAKTYGRHSKSINPDECVCGACKTGKLVPLFETRTPQKTKKASSGKMATTQPRDSPLRGPGLRTGVPADNDPSDSLLDALTAAVGDIKI